MQSVSHVTLYINPGLHAVQRVTDSHQGQSLFHCIRFQEERNTQPQSNSVRQFPDAISPLQMDNRKVLHQLIAALQANENRQPSISEASDDPVHRELITQSPHQAGHPLAEQLNSESPEFYANQQRASPTAGSNHVSDVLQVPCHHQENSSLPSNVSNPTPSDRATSAANVVMRIARQQQSPDQLSGEHRHPEVLPEHEHMIVTYFCRHAIGTLLKAMWNHPRAADAEERLRTYIDHVLLKRKQRVITVPQLLHSISNHVRRSCEAASCIDVLHDRKTLDARGLLLFKQQWSRRAEQ